MRLQYYLMPMHKAAAWQVVDGDNFNIGCVKVEGVTYGFEGREHIYNFVSNASRDLFISAGHKHLAEWAYGKEEVPEAVREANIAFEKIIGETGSVLCENYYHAWREKWMKPKEPRHMGNFMYEV